MSELSYLEQVQKIYADREIDGESPEYGNMIAAVKMDLGVGIWVANQRPFFVAIDMFDPETADVAQEKVVEYAQSFGNTKKPSSAVRFFIEKDDVLNYNTTNWNGDREEVILQWTAGPRYPKSDERESVSYWASSHRFFPEGLDAGHAVLDSVINACAPDKFGEKVYCELGRHIWKWGDDDKTRYCSYVVRVFDSFEEAVTACGDKYNGNKPEGFGVGALPQPKNYSNPLVAWNVVADMLMQITGQATTEKANGGLKGKELKDAVVENVKGRNTWDGLNIPEHYFADAYDRQIPF